jgi:hypothetical protein
MDTEAFSEHCSEIAWTLKHSLNTEH